MSDPQVSILNVLKPIDGFEAVYQGQSGTIPIAFPGTLDSNAAQGIAGYNPNLLRGVPMPMYSRVILWIPQTLASTGETVEVVTNYQYQVLFRLRNVNDFKRATEAGGKASDYPSYHLKGQTVGREDLVFLPGASKVLAYEQAEPSGTDPGLLNLRPERMVPRNGVWVPPLLKNGEDAVWQQGTYPFAGDLPDGPTWMPFQFDMEGDEMCILVYKTTGNAWDFTDNDEDRSFSDIYGTSNGTERPNPFIGILFGSGVGSP